MAVAHQVNDKPRLSLSDYQNCAQATNRLGRNDSPRDYLRFGFFGEVGGLLSLVKKARRELVSAEHNAVTEEIGDALWYLANVAAQYDTSMLSVGQESMAELQRQLGVQWTVEGELTFEEFDGLMELCHSKLPATLIPSTLRRLASDAGSLLHSDPQAPDLASEAPHRLLGRLLADLVIVAALFRQRIAQVAASNLKKIASRWPGPNPTHIALFDEGRSLLEQFPRRFTMHFIECQPEPGTRPYVIQRLNDVNIGDRLTDNRTEQDGYRFHDVFHLAYLVHLGWSPVIRALLKLKRKTDKALDENEDGARAIIIEEGVATWIFNHAHRRDYFRNTEVGRLEYGLLKQVVDMVDGYEVARCPMWQWERAILDGFKAFRDLVEHGGGLIHADLESRTLDFEARPFQDAPRTSPPRPALIGALPPV